MRKLFIDAGIDFTPEFLLKNDIGTLPFSFFIDDQEYLSDTTYTKYCPEFINNILKTNSIKLSRPPFQEWYNRIEAGLQDYDEILYVSISQKTSGCLQTFNLIAEDLKLKYPDKAFYGVDSLLATSGYTLLILLFYPYLNTPDFLTRLEQLKKQIKILVVPDRLVIYNQTARGQAIEQNISKAILSFDQTGTFLPVHTVKSQADTLEFLVQELQEYDQILISYTFDKQDCEEIKYLKESFKDKLITCTFMSPSCSLTVGSAYTISGIKTVG